MNQSHAMLYDASKKSAGIAYFLALFLGGLGIHCFYVGKKVARAN